MGVVRSVEICMAPSVALSRGEASTMGGVVEQTILRDYFNECSRTPPNRFQSPQATKEDWWDTGNREHYKVILLERHHPGINEQQLRGMKRLKIPDISTWKGIHQRNKAIDPTRPADRNELYEIKPDSAWGMLKGLEKLKGIEDNHRDLGLRGYKLGSWYPAPAGPDVIARKQVSFDQMPYIEASFWYRLRRMMSSMRALGATLRINSVLLEIERRTAGLLYYKICVKMDLDFDGAEKVAQRVIRRLYEALTETAETARRIAELNVAASYRVMDKQGKPVPEPPPDPRVVRALDAEEQFRVDKINLVPELDNMLSALGQALFSRLRGLPGEQFLVCCDETFLENEIKLPQKVRQSKLLKNLQVRPPIPVQGALALAGGIAVPMSYMLAALYVVAKVADSPFELFHSPENFRAAQRWLEANPAYSLVIGGAVVYGTALVVAGTVATGGALFAAAPAAGSAAGAGAPAGAGLQTPLGTGLARGLAGETIKDAALPMVEEALPMGEKAMQQMLQKSATTITEEAGRRIAEREVRVLAERQLKQVAQTEIEKATARALAREVAAEQMKKALAVGGVTLGAVALRMAFSGAPANTPNSAPTGTMSAIAAETGSLHLLKLNPDVDLNRLPQLYAEANYSGFSGEIPGGFVIQTEPTTPAAIKPKYFHLGVIRCL
ncbi:hypothetical protein [Dongia sp. agr-C8]